MPWRRRLDGCAHVRLQRQVIFRNCEAVVFVVASSFEVNLRNASDPAAVSAAAQQVRSEILFDLSCVNMLRISFRRIKQITDATIALLENGKGAQRLTDKQVSEDFRPVLNYPFG